MGRERCFAEYVDGSRLKPVRVTLKRRADGVVEPVRRAVIGDEYIREIVVVKEDKIIRNAFDFAGMLRTQLHVLQFDTKYTVRVAFRWHLDFSGN